MSKLKLLLDSIANKVDELARSAIDATTTVLVPEEGRERANALYQVSHPLAGVFAPALAGLLYTLVGLEGVIVLDLITFLVTVAAVALVLIPQPKISELGAATRSSFWQEMRGGFRFLADRQWSVLLGLILYMCFIYFLLNGPLELVLPYLVIVTGSEAVAGTIMGVMSLGAMVGALLMTVWKGTRPRIHTLLVGHLLVGVMFLVYGVARSPWLLGASLVVGELVG